MTKYSMVISSKNKKSLKTFIIFLKLKFKLQKLKIILNSTKKKKISVLKSPHVNKTAQNQYMYIFYKITINICSFNTSKYLLFLKKIKDRLFPDIYIKIRSTLKTKNQQKIIKNFFFTPNNFTFKMHRYNNTANQTLNTKELRYYQKYMFYKKKEKNKNLLRKLTSYIKIFDCYGNLNF